MNRNMFAGSGALLRLLVRRDRVRLAVWLIGLAGFAAGFVPVFENLLTDNSGNSVFAAMMENPAMVAIVGPVYGLDRYHTGAMYANMMLLFSAILAGVLNIFLITRHTRQDEEQGRLEVIRSLPVGRLSNLAAALFGALLVNGLLTVFTACGLYILRGEGMDLNGCMLFGAVMGITGLFFASATALFCQLSSNNRTATSFSMMLLLLMYMLRAAGDMGTEILSMVSPLGVILRTKAFVDNLWWPVLLVFAVSAAITVLAFVLAHVRDLGRGLVAERPGRCHAGLLLSGPFGLSLRLLRSSLITWVVVVFVLSGMYGSVFGDMEGFLDSNEMVKAIFAGDGGRSLIEQFTAKLMAVMTMIGTIPVLSVMVRAAAEEKRGHSEHILGRAISRSHLLASYLVPAFFLSIVLQVLAALGFWSVGSLVLDTTPTFGTFFVSALSYLPAIWVMLGIAACLAAFAPGKTVLSYLYLGYSFFTVYLGSIAGFPDWSLKVTPFGHIPQYPVEELSYPVFVVLAALAAGLTVLSFIGYRRRDMRTQ